jgi:hypothetical protein
MHLKVGAVVVGESQSWLFGYGGILREPSAAFILWSSTGEYGRPANLTVEREVVWTYAYNGAILFVEFLQSIRPDPHDVRFIAKGEVKC